MRRFALALFAGGLLVAAANVFAAEPSKDLGQIKSLVGQLGSDNYDERQNATAALEQVGEPALPLLREALKNPDCEIRKRAERLVPRIETRIETTRVLTPLHVRFSCKDLTIAEAAAEFSKQTGHPIQIGPNQNTLAQRRITLDTGNTTFWDAFDQFCAKAGVREMEVAVDVNQNPNTIYMNRVRMRGGRFGGNIAYYGGPRQVLDPTLVLEDGAAAPSAMVRNSSLRIRALAPKTGVLANLPDGAKPIALQLEVRTEARMELTELNAVRITHATDADGRRVRTAQGYIDGNSNGFMDPDLGFMIAQQMEINGDMSGFGNLRQVPISLVIEGQATQKLGELSGVISARVRTAPEALVTIGDLSKAVGKASAAVDGSEVKVTECKRADDGLFTIKVELKDGALPNQQEEIQMQRLIRLRAVRGLAQEGQVTQFTKDNAAGLPFKLFNTKGEVLEIVNGEMMLAADNPSVRVYTLVYKPAANDTAPARFEYLGRREVDVEVPFTLKEVPLVPKAR